MIEIKVTGGTAEEIRESLAELNKVVGTEVEGFSSTTIAKTKRQKPVEEKPVAEERHVNVNVEKPVEKKPVEKKPVAEERHVNVEKPVAEERHVNVEKPVAEERHVNVEKPVEEATYTLEQVRARAIEMQRAGKKDLVKEVITSVGAKKLTEVDPGSYAFVMECFKAGEVLPF